MKKAHLIWGFVMLALLLVYGLINPEQYIFPHCPFRTMTGWLCPGCGSQRAIHHLLHGHITESFRLNALLIPGCIYALTGYVLSFFYPDKWAVIRRTWYGKRAAYIALGVILIFWIGRNLF